MNVSLNLTHEWEHLGFVGCTFAKMMVALFVGSIILKTPKEGRGPTL
jgi:hypothetical protein